VLATGGLLAIFIVVGLGAFPVGALRGMAERKLSDEFGAPVTIGGLSRAEFFTFSPEIIVRDVRIGQPRWAGTGDFLRIGSTSARVPIFSLLAGSPDVQTLRIADLDAALVRDAQGRSNWAGRTERTPPAADRPFRLERLLVERGRFSLRDAKRRLELRGTLAAGPSSGLKIEASGTFDGAPARLTASGSPLAASDASAAWPFTARLAAGAFDLDARGTMADALNMQSMKLKMRARGSTLKQLDYIIEAGLFGTQDIDLSGDVRRDGSDWHVDRLDGTIGRSRLHAKATVLKRGGRTKIDATVEAPQFDFDDLADDAGLALARAKEARIGKRVIPDTRINLSRMGPTDGTIRFSAARLLIKGGSAFRSLKGDLVLDRRLLRVENMVAGLDAGRLTGRVEIDSRGNTPILAADLRLTGSSLATMIGQPDMIRGPLQGVVRISGQGDTVREAFASGSGKIAFSASSGAVNRAAAFILGQDLGGAIGQKLGDEDAMTPLRCAILVFTVKGGVLTPAPLTIDTEVSRGTGRGRIDLDGETIALTLAGAAREKAALKLVDPIRVTGTLSSPAIALEPPGTSKKQSGGVFGMVTRSIGSALGLRKDRKSAAPPPAAAANCPALVEAALR
jgi:uncharacterized protein involved in outer membrane biogenesis